MIKLKSLMREELIGTYRPGAISDEGEIFKNPKSISKMTEDLRAWSFPNGDLFVIDDNWSVIHSHFASWLNKHGYPIPKGDSLGELAEQIKRGYIPWQRKGKTNSFYLSESVELDREDLPYFTSKKLMPYIKKYSAKVKAKNSKYNFVLEMVPS